MRLTHNAWELAGIGQSYPVEYYLESVEEYSEGKIHMSEPESGNGKVNTVYFVNQTWEILESVARSEWLQMFT